MSEIDWSKAPEGATHYRAPGGMYYGGFYKREPDGQWFFFVDAQWEFLEKPEENAAYPLIPRPTKQEWEGGLPPVGVECEFSCDNGSSWHKTAILYSDDYAVLLENYHLFQVKDAALRFRPLKSQHERQREELACMLGGAMGLSHDFYAGADAAIKFFEERYNLELKP